MTGNIAKTLRQRGARYGAFIDQAATTQRLKAVMAETPGWDGLAPDQKEALHHIQTKVGRILHGDPNYADSWHDISGYAHLVFTRLSALFRRRRRS